MRDRAAQVWAHESGWLMLILRSVVGPSWAIHVTLTLDDNHQSRHHYRQRSHFTETDDDGMERSEDWVRVV